MPNRRISKAGVVVSVVLGMVAAGVLPVAAPTLVPGNPTCSDVCGGCNYIMLKIDPPVSGTYHQGGLSVTVTFSADGKYVSWTSNLGIDAVIVKGGPDAYVYTYSPEATSGTGLHSPLNPGGEIPKISHVTFCWDAELIVSKTANGSFERKWDWEITKSVVPPTLTIGPSASGVVTYSITGNATYIDTNFAASGTITVFNPHPTASTTVTVTDTVDGYSATVSPSSFGLGPNSSVTCTWNVTGLPGPVPRNTATATSSNPAIGSGSATVSITYTMTAEEDERARLVDVQTCPPGFACATAQVWPVDLSAPGPHTIQFSKTITNVSAPCGTEHRLTNTATLTELDTGQTRTASAEVSIYTGPCPNQGCSPGYWKNHPSAWGPTGYSPTQLVSSVFSRAGTSPYGPTPLGNATLMAGLSFQGSNTVVGAAEILLRTAIAAILNAAHPGVNYPLTVASIVAQVNAALHSQNRSTILSLATVLDGYNNLGCPLR